MYEDPWADYLKNGVVRLGPNGERTVIPPPQAPAPSTGYTGPYAAGTVPVRPTQTVQRPAAPPPAASDYTPYRNAIASIESAGSGGYRALGPWTRRGDRAYGRYQVMGNNVGPWTEAALGQRLTPQQFLTNPQAQDAVFDHIFGGYVRKYGNPQDAASAWFTGRPLSGGAGARDLYGTTGAGYVARFNRALGNPSTASAGNQPMPQKTVYDNRGAGMAGYGPVIPLPASPFQPGVGGSGQRTVEPGPQGNDPISQMIRNLIANRQSSRGGGGILGRALMMGLAGAASRVGGPAGGLVAGLASGLGSRMGSRGDEEYQRQMQILDLMMRQKKYEQGNQPETRYTDQGYFHIPQPGQEGQPDFHPYAGIPGYTAPLEKPNQIDPTKPIQTGPNQYEYPTIAGTPPVTPEDTAKQSEAYNKVSDQFYQNPRAARHRASIDIYNGMLESSQNVGPEADQSLMSDLARLRNPLGTRMVNGSWVDDESVLEEMKRVVRKYATGEGGTLSPESRYNLMKEARILQENYRKGYMEVRKQTPKEALGGLDIEKIAPAYNDPYPEIDKTKIGGYQAPAAGAATAPQAGPTPAEIEAEIKRRGL